MKKYLEKEKAIDTLARLYERIKREEHNQEAANGVWRAMEAIAGLGDAWIPVAERTPEAELQSSIKERGEYAVVPVLASAQKRNAEGKAYIVTDRAFYFELFGVKNFHNDKAEPMKVLAWMPLPEPYKEAEG